MKITMYGTEICSDCVQTKKDLADCKDIELVYKNITADTATLKEFLSFRDKEEMFLEVKERGGIGIPFFVLENGKKTFDISDFAELPQKKGDFVHAANYCSIDNPGQC